VTTITIPRETFDQMREKIEKALIYLAHSGKFSRSSAKTVLNEALSAAKAVSETKVKLIPTAEELGTPVQPQAQGEVCEHGTSWDTVCRRCDDEAMLAHPQASEPAEKDDPLQGAVDWLLQADGEFFAVATVQRTLRIGYNRAKRLADIARERAAAPEATK